MNILKKCNTILLFNDDPTDGANPNFLYHGGCDVDNSILILKKNSKLLLTPKMNYTKAKASCKLKITSYSSKDIQRIILKHATGKIGIDFNSVSHARYLRLKKLFKKDLIDISSQLQICRMVKTKDELSKISKSVKIAKQILKEIEGSLTPSKTEKQIEKELLLLCIRHEVTPSFSPIVASGKNSANPHHTPSNKKLGKSIVLIDFGVKYQNYCSDLTRCFFLGDCKAERVKYSEAKQIFDKITREIPNLKNIAKFSAFSDSVISQHGWGKLIHAIGHGIGLEVHESPSIYSKSKQKLSSNIVLAIEPGWYGKTFGVRYEQNILITKTGAKLL